MGTLSGQLTERYELRWNDEDHTSSDGKRIKSAYVLADSEGPLGGITGSELTDW